MSKILLLEDDLSLINGLSFAFKKQGFELNIARTLKEADALWADGRYDLLVLDVSLPDGTGFEFCKRVRQVSKVPIIFLTASDEETSIIMGLDMGGDDYITKPFRPLELVARVKAQLRRYKHYNSGSGMTDDIISCSGLSLNVKTHECTLNERPLTLTPTEFSILCILCSHKGNVVSAEELFHQVWGDEYFNKSNNTITVHIRHLREKMGDSFEEPKYIKTVWGCGYKIEA